MGNITIGVTGRGETSLRNGTALIEDYLEARMDDVVSFVLDLTVDEAGELSRGVRAAGSVALANGLDIEAVIPQGQADPTDNEQYAALLEAAKLTVKVANPTVGVARRSTVLFVAWDEQDDPELEGVKVPTSASIKALEAAERFSVPAHDLTDGLLPLAFDDGQEQPAEEPAPTGRTDEASPSVRTKDGDTPESDSTDTLRADTIRDDTEAMAAKVAAAVLAEITPLIEQIKAQTAPRPRGRPRKQTEED